MISGSAPAEPMLPTAARSISGGLGEPEDREEELSESDETGQQKPDAGETDGRFVQ